jgi:NAD+ synthase (glutamine-hydrolysing)
MKLTLCQLNPVVGDVSGNVGRIKAVLEKTRDEKPDLVIFPELFLTGYPPQDLLERKWFLARVEAGIADLVRTSENYPPTGIVFGAPRPTMKDNGRGLYNSAFLVYRGKIEFIQHKSLLPTYDVFDEARYFDPSPEIKVFKFKNEVIGISICEDAWNSSELWSRRYYDLDPIQILARKGARIMINIAASPFSIGKEVVRHDLIRDHARKHKVNFVFVNQVGGNDELIFDGTSMILSDQGEIRSYFDSFREDVRTVDLRGNLSPVQEFRPMEKIESVYRALVLGLSDYARKNGFQKALIGLSGGIDSAIVACLARDAFGAENVLGVTMPGPYSSAGSVEDSKTLAQHLKIGFKTVSINEIYNEYLKTLKDHFEGRKPDITEENIQARIRGNLLMALANKFGHLVLATGNKSEIAVGYCTLYGDMSGGLSVIADVPKTMVCKLAEHVNRTSEIIPKSVIVKPPSAELRPNQTDQDTLPAYEILDQILQWHVEEGLAGEEIVKKGFEARVVDWVINAVKKSEFKRRQAAPGLKVTSKAFGPGRRMPVTARY